MTAPPTVPQPPSYQPPPSGQPYYYPPPPRRSRRKWPWVVLGVVVLFIIIGVANSPSPPSSTTGLVPTPETAQAADPPAPPPEPTGPATSFGDGTHVIGTDIVPGTYRTAGPVSNRIPELALCIWQRLENTSGEIGSAIASDITKGPATVTISLSDGAFKSSGCTTWHKVG